MAFAVLKQKSGEEYLIFKTVVKFSRAERMCLFCGLEDGSTDLGLILKRSKRDQNHLNIHVLMSKMDFKAVFKSHSSMFQLLKDTSGQNYNKISCMSSLRKHLNGKTGR